MDAGKPVVLTDCSGRPSGFVDGEHGWVVPAGSTRALEAAIERVARLPRAQREQMGESARRLARERYDIDAIGRAFVGHVVDLVAARDTRSHDTR
jgi:glycosyltransferase involved in cell wall biosynthesis